jgi:hypothetical protein
MAPKIEMTVEEFRKAQKGKAKMPRVPGMEAEEVRRWALRVLHEMVELTQDKRDRVLKHALTVNRAVLRNRKGKNPEENGHDDT